MVKKKNKTSSFFINNINIIYSILFIVVVRLLLSLLPSFQIDMGTWIGWSQRLIETGFGNFYSDITWTQYTPGFLYYLWIIGKLGITSELLIKIPIILADVFVGVLIYLLTKKTNKNFATIALFLYALNPFVFFDGSVWGQIDGLLTLFLFLSAIFLVEKKNLTLSMIFWALAFLIKPQAIAILPIYLVLMLTKNMKLKSLVLGIVSSISTIFLGSVLFFPNDPVLGLPKLILKMSSSYSYTSVNAFNVWSIVGLWTPDNQIFAGLKLSVWGTILFIFSIAFAIYIFKNNLKQKSNWYLLLAIFCLAFFLFPTKVHERYIFPFFAFLLLSTGLSKSKSQWGIYILTSIAGLINLYYPYSYYNSDQLRNDFIFNMSYSIRGLIAIIFTASFLSLIFWKKIDVKVKILINNISTHIKSIKKENTVNSFSKIKISKKSTRIILCIILIFAFITRIFELGSPSTMYFDEVYHAFTARVMMGVDRAKAWEWWNTPPEGFAYEWTHPPLAKLGMVLGMSIFGQNSFGWRIPEAILGVGSVFLVYLLSKKLFKDEVVGLISAGVFSLDGLALVMSRIGMNDSYILFFSLLSIYLFMKEKDFLSATSYGLALASKWSALWAAPIIFILWIKRKHRIRPSILWFLILPPVIYLLSYLPMFTTGHDMNIWWGMQEQMWWYHTNLRATHPYSSPWWSWPFLVRPIYLYTSDEINGFVSRIYAMGNPFVFWFGLISVFYGALYSFVEKNKNLGLIIFSYLVFFVPWAASPRIMFLYHYLPSIPFLAIATGYVLRKNQKLIFPYFLICFLAFLYFYPHWTGLNIPLWLDKSYYWVTSWR